MPNMIRRFFAILLCLAASFVVGALDAAPVGSAFTYQGRLSELGLPAAGAHDFQFSLHRQPYGGAPVAASLTVINVPVSNGIFTAILDFGLDAFSGSESWLEVAVRRTGVAGDFLTLSPRQPLTPVPYSLFTLKAASLAGSLPDTQLSTNIARLDSSQTFRGEVSFERTLKVGSSNQPASMEVYGSVRAGSFAGDGGALSNVVAAGLSARQMQRLWRIPIPFVAVTNAGNLPDLNGKGAVPDDFRIGKYEINNHQYAAFLNAVAADDPRSLYNTNSAAESHAGIVRTGAPGEFFYEVKPGMGHQPVVLVDFYDVLRFCNWLHHGQPSGAQDATTTEDGAYTLTPATLAAENVLRNPGARFWLPSDDEWYKAAYQPLDTGGEFGDYWTYPTRSLDVPISEPPPGGPNSVNACCDTGRMATDVGAYPLARSYYGTYDQGGNVQEWTEWTDEFSPLRNRRIRGGSWDYNEYYSGKDDYEFDTTDYDSNSIGFRVAGRADLF
jgi:formylglycine-generating enzyme required for sulfatase activity